MTTRQQSFPDPVVPPGLTEATMTNLVLSLPHRRGVVRLAGYYQLGPDLIVVYDVLDEQGTRVSGGTVYPLGAEEVGPTRARSGTR